MYKFLLFFLFISFFLSGQKQPADSIYLMNGRIVTAPIIDTLLGAATFVDPDDSTKRSHIENDRLFAIRYHTGDVFYYYKMDTLNGSWFTQEEMWYFTQGERDARKGFKPWYCFSGSMAAGIAGGITGSFVGPIPPLIYLACTGLTKVRIRHKTVSNIDLLEHDAYILGYERVSRYKRRIYSLIAGGIGLVLGYGTYFIITH